MYKLLSIVNYAQRSDRVTVSLHIKGNRNTTTLLFSPKEFEIVHQERRGQVKTIVMEHFNGILFHKIGPANKQHINHSSHMKL